MIMDEGGDEMEGFQREVAQQKKTLKTRSLIDAHFQGFYIFYFISCFFYNGVGGLVFVGSSTLRG